MPDIEKIIKGLEYCIKSDDCRGCIYWESVRHEECPMPSNALELLKEYNELKKNESKMKRRRFMQET